MRALVLTFAAAAALTAGAPAAEAQGVRIDAPGVHLGVGPRYHRDHWRDREYQFRDRATYRGGCRTVTIQRDNGVTKQIRRCD